jgi:hypothetical protein
MSLLTKIKENINNPEVLLCIKRGIDEETKYNNMVEEAMFENEKNPKLGTYLKNQKYKEKEGNIVIFKSELVNKNNKYSVDTELNINIDMNDKVKRALIKSIIEELNKNFDEYDFFYQKKN